MRTVIGIVGYYGFVRAYPLGPELMERLQAQAWPQETEIREMNWGPVAIVQDFQAEATKPGCVVLVESNFKDASGFKGIDILRAIRSFDPCMPCTTHMMVEGTDRVVTREVTTCACGIG